MKCISPSPFIENNIYTFGIRKSNLLKKISKDNRGSTETMYNVYLYKTSYN